MADLLGIIAQLKTFMDDSDSVLNVLSGDDKTGVLKLERGRVYCIPDFQREIRWTSDDVDVLIEDITTGPKFLGNVILAKDTNINYIIIDGQQRITILTMIINCIKQLYDKKIDVMNPCKLKIDSFLKFSDLMNADFDKTKVGEREVDESDKLKQYKKYKELWEHIKSIDVVTNKRKAKQFIENLNSSSFNIMVDQSENMEDSVRYFIDVNLKGKQLDDEDIFKSYLFKNDPSEEIREQWYRLKENVVQLEGNNVEYTLLNLLEHYFLCDLYTNDEFKGMEFNSHFLLNKQFSDKDGHINRKGTHLIELISDNEYLKKSLSQLNCIIQLMIDIVGSQSVTTEFKNQFSETSENSEIDNVEQIVIHNIIKKIIKDKKTLPKALLMKYFLTLIYGEQSDKSTTIRSIYGIYLFTVLFTIFENKKSKEILINTIKAKEDCWYDELMVQISGYFSLDKITDARILAQYKFAQNENNEDYTYTCKSLATVYNFFEKRNNQICIKKGEMDNLKTFLEDDETYSIEHFIISKSKNSVIGKDMNYTLDKGTYNKYVNNFFNFIFISKELNTKLQNYWLPKKLELMENEEVDCDYSKMIIEQTRKLVKHFPCVSIDNYQDKLDSFFMRDFKDVYLGYAKAVLENIIEHIKGEEE